MAINRFNQLLNNQQYVSTYVPMPLQDIIAVGNRMQQVQDQGAAERAQFLNKSWNRLPADVQRSVEIQNELNSKLESFANKDFNDPNVKADWYRTKLDIAKQFSPNGEVGAQEANYNLFYKEKDKLDKMLEKGSKDGGIDKGTYDYLLNKAVNAFSTSGGTGKLGPAGFNTVKFDTPATYQDIYKQAQDATAHWKADAISKGGYRDTNGQFIKKSTQEIEAIDPNEIIKYVTPALMADPMNQAFARQQVAINSYGRNIDPNLQQQAYMDIFRKPVEAVANEMGYTKKKYDEDWKDNSVEQYKAKRAFDNHELEKQYQFNIGIRPSDQNDPSLTSAGMNANLRASGNAIANHWQFDDNGNLILKDNYQDTKQVVNINGKNYNLDNLPKGYTLEVEQSGFSNPGSPRQFNQLVKGPDGKSLPVQNIKVDNQELYKGMQELSQAAGRLGYHGDLEGTKDFYGNWLKDNYNRQMNFTQFDQGTQKAFSEALGVKGKFDDGGNFIISNPGQLSFSTLKGLDGKEITGDALKNKASLLEGSKIIGVVQSMTNDNYQPGDLYLQTKDNGIMIINPKNKTINDALTSSTVLTKSFNNFVNTGKQIISDEDRQTLTKYKIPLDQVTGVVHDKQGNYFVGNIGFDKDKGTAIPQVTVYTTDGNVHILELDEANKILESSYLKPIIPSYNNKNFDRFTKTENLGTGLEIEE